MILFFGKSWKVIYDGWCSICICGYQIAKASTRETLGSWTAASIGSFERPVVSLITPNSSQKKQEKITSQIQNVLIWVRWSWICTHWYLPKNPRDESITVLDKSKSRLALRPPCHLQAARPRTRTFFITENPEIWRMNFWWFTLYWFMWDKSSKNEWCNEWLTLFVMNWKQKLDWSEGRRSLCYLGPRAALFSGAQHQQAIDLSTKKHQGLNCWPVAPEISQLGPSR